MKTITRDEYWRLRKLISQHKLSYYRVIAWTQRAWGMDELEKITPPMLKTLVLKIPVWGQQVADEKEMEAERAAIQAADLDTPIILSADWIEDYRQEEMRHHA